MINSTKCYNNENICAYPVKIDVIIYETLYCIIIINSFVQ